MIFLVSVTPVMAVAASPDYGSGEEERQVTPEMLEECQDLGIAPENCNEIEILQKRPRSSPVQPENPHMDLIPLYVGIAGAFAAGIIYVKKTGRWKVRST